MQRTRGRGKRESGKEEHRWTWVAEGWKITSWGRTHKREREKRRDARLEEGRGEKMQYLVDEGTKRRRVKV